MKLTSLRFMTLLVLLALGFMIANCGGNNIKNNLSAPAATNTTPTGPVVAGKVTGPPAASVGTQAGRSAAANGLTAKTSISVEAYLISDERAKTGDTLATTTTNSSGEYSIILPLGYAATSSLVLSAGAGNNQMRSIVTSTSVDIDPITELVYAKIAANSAALSSFSTIEVAAIVRQVRSDAASIDLSTKATVSDAVSALYTGQVSSNLDTMISTAGSCAVACYADTDCDDANSSTVNICMNDGACESSCAFREARRLDLGAYHTCILEPGSGRIRCMGWNRYGQLGNGTNKDSAATVRVTGITDAVAVALGKGKHTCALLYSGGVKCWGWNVFGAVGDGTNTDASVPRDVIGINDAVAITAGYYQICTLHPGGNIKCWGRNDNGQLGNGEITHSSVPVDVTGINNAIAVEGGGHHTCALLSGGTVKCWGWNGDGQLGDRTTTDKHVPVDVIGITGAIALSTGGENHNCVLFSAGNMKCWGDNYFGQLGNGTTTDSLTPVDVIGITNAVAITTGYLYTCALLQDGKIRCWGLNAYGEHGNGTIANSSVPVDVTGINNAEFVRAGGNHTCALVTGGGLKCWGGNFYGQLGNWTLTNSTTPVALP